MENIRVAEKPRSNFAFINALRGIAAILVVLFHQQIHTFFQYPDREIPKYSLTWWFFFGFFDLGKYAVAVFFLVSGFLIPATLRKKSSNLKEYAIHRIFRLYPAYWVAIIFHTVCLLLIRPGIVLPTRQIFFNFTMLQKFFGVEDYIGVFWTLQIELIFYVLCALLFHFRRLESRPQIQAVMLALGLVCALVRLTVSTSAPVALFIALQLMFFGDMLRVSVSESVPKPIYRISLLIATLGTTATCFLGYGSEGLRYSLCYLAAIATFLLSMYVASWFEKNGFRRRILDYLGDISYGVYLFNSTILLGIASPIYARTGSKLITTACILPIVLAMATVVYRLIEAPFIRLGRHITARNSDKHA